MICIVSEAEPGPVTRYGSKDSISSDHSNRDDLDEQWVSQVNPLLCTWFNGNV